MAETLKRFQSLLFNVSFLNSISKMFIFRIIKIIKKNKDVFDIKTFIELLFTIFHFLSTFYRILSNRNYLSNEDDCLS